MFCKKAASKIRELYKKFDKFMEEHIDDALRISTAIKRYLESPTTDLLVAIIPTDYDKLARDIVLRIVSKTVDVLSIEQKCAAETDVLKKLACWAIEIKKLPADVQEGMLVKFAQKYAKQADNRYPQNVYDFFVQGQYTATK